MTFLARARLSPTGQLITARLFVMLGVLACLLSVTPAFAVDATYKGWVLKSIPYFYPPECAEGAPVTSACTARTAAALAAAQDGYSVEITNPKSNVSLNWTYLNGDKNAALKKDGESLCSQDVAINFSYTDAYGNPTGNGTCILSQGQALVQSTQATLPNCDPNNSSSWSTGCVMPPVCPSGVGGSSYYCGSNSKSPAICSCTASTAGSGASSACTGTSDGSGNYVANSYYCGTGSTCACTPPGSAGATASYCAIGQANTPSTPCIPQPNYYSLSPVSLKTPYTVSIQKELVDIVDNINVDANFAAIVNNIGLLSDETNGCRNDH